MYTQWLHDGPVYKRLENVNVPSRAGARGATTMPYYLIIT